jgi:hypothetical protein
MHASITMHYACPPEQQLRGQDDQRSRHRRRQLAALGPLV